MNSIKSLLQQMDDSKLFLGKNHSIKIYGDGSGSITHLGKNIQRLTFEFDDEVEMIKVLTDLYNELNEFKDMKWTL